MTKKLSKQDIEKYTEAFTKLMYSRPKCMPKSVDKIKMLNDEEKGELMWKGVLEKTESIVNATANSHVNLIIYHCEVISSVVDFLDCKGLALDANEQLMCEELAKKLQEIFLKHAVIAFTSAKIEEEENE
jgi:hypothetical protein